MLVNRASSGGAARGFILHDDVIQWKHFARYSLAPWAGNSPVTGEFHSQRPLTRGFDDSLFFTWTNGWRDANQSGRRWFEPPSRLLWRQCNEKDAVKFIMWRTKPTKHDDTPPLVIAKALRFHSKFYHFAAVPNLIAKHICLKII